MTATAEHYRFRHVARMEWIKLRTLRSVRWTLLFALAGMIGIGIAAGFNTQNPRGDVTSNILVGGALGSVLFAVLGVLVMTSEYSSGTIRATLAAIPRRSLVLAAKAAVFGVMALAAGELVTFAGFLAGAAFVHGGVPRPALSQPEVLRAVALSGAYLCLVGLLGLALGAIVRHGAAAITALVGLGLRGAASGAGGHPGGPAFPRLHRHHLARGRQLVVARRADRHCGGRAGDGAAGGDRATRALAAACRNLAGRLLGERVAAPPPRMGPG